MTHHHTTTDTTSTTSTTSTPNRRTRRHPETGSARTKVLAGIALVGVLGAVGAFVVLGGGSDPATDTADAAHRSDRAASRVVTPTPTVADPVPSPATDPSNDTGTGEVAPATVTRSDAGAASGPAAPALADVRDDLGDPPGSTATGPGGYTIERVCCFAPETPGVITTVPPATGLPALTLPPGVLLPLLPGAGMLPTPSVTLPPLGR